MRLADLLHPYLDGVAALVDATGGDPDLGPFLHLPAGMPVRPDDGTGELGGDLLVLLPHPPPDGPPDALPPLLERLRPGARGLAVFRHPPGALPYQDLLDGLVDARCQVLRAEPLDYAGLGAAAVFARTDRPLPPHGPAGPPAAGNAGPPEQDPLRTVLRLAGEHALAGLVCRAQRARLLDLEAARETAALTASGAAAPGQDGHAASVRRERDRLAAALRRAHDRVEVLEARVAVLKHSTSLRVGQSMVSAARDPVRGVPRLPRELYGLWRARRRPSPARPPHPLGNGAGRPPAPAAELPEGSGERLHLAHRAVAIGPRDRLVIAGLLTDDTAAALAGDAVVNRLLPHDARLVVEQSAPDLLVVQTGAARSGPWSGCGTGAAPGLDRRLAEALTVARALGCRTVLWRDAAPSTAPGLSRLDFDGVLDAPEAVRPDRLDPAAMDREELREIFASHAVRVRLAELARAGGVTGAPGPPAARRIAVLAAPRDPAEVTVLVKQVLAQSHRPVEVVVPGAGRELAELAAAGVAVRDGAGGPTAPWAACWHDLTADRGAAHLADLMCAQECSGADAIGFPVAAGPGAGPGDPGPEAHRFVATLEPALVRSALLRTGGTPEDWFRRGFRLYAVPRGEPR
ncbi:hypothetical protein [Streptomyces aidingensis]|uniref:Uncharacterized protein n=1 Tax=Streptomyces aidingensis TaxID=910347 RepID=A0A1I1PMF8_9ACTN|nr:hypothetical protein [Streptomyces aidingensis]SFD07200.1 hypothetical protein SAMN05421773_10989 [Streptomyces aidingensis]